MCESELAIKGRTQIWETSARWNCEIGFAEIRKLSRSLIWDQSARQRCETNIADFRIRSRSQFWRRFVRKSCEKRASRNFICEIVLRAHTRSSPWHNSQDKIFWENIWPLEHLRDGSARTYSQILKRHCRFALTATQEEARPCQPISSLVFTSLLILNI